MDNHLLSRDSVLKECVLYKDSWALEHNDLGHRAASHMNQTTFNNMAASRTQARVVAGPYTLHSQPSCHAQIKARPPPHRNLIRCKTSHGTGTMTEQQGTNLAFSYAGLVSRPGAAAETCLMGKDHQARG